MLGHGIEWMCIETQRKAVHKVRICRTEALGKECPVKTEDVA